MVAEKVRLDDMDQSPTVSPSNQGGLNLVIFVTAAFVSLFPHAFSFSPPPHSSSACILVSHSANLIPSCVPPPPFARIHNLLSVVFMVFAVRMLPV